MSHTPVMLAETIAALAPRDGDVIVDGTLGAGGYARAILSAANCSLYAFDCDPTAIHGAQKWASEFGDRLTLVESRFGDMEQALTARGVSAVDGVVLDIGVSSMQLDKAERGFSFRSDGPLSMRMDGGKPDASDLINAASVDDLAEIFRVYGEERHALRFARAIDAARLAQPIETTSALSSVLEEAHPRRSQEKIHPATRVFQAIRIFVNDELGQLAKALLTAERLLRPAGRIAVVTFHSLEDRMVKKFFADRSARSGGGASRHAPAPRDAAPPPTFETPARKPTTPGADEVATNPRARSAKLRSAIRTTASAAANADPRALAPRLALSADLNCWSV